MFWRCRRQGPQVTFLRTGWNPSAPPLHSMASIPVSYSLLTRFADDWFFQRFKEILLRRRLVKPHTPDRRVQSSLSDTRNTSHGRKTDSYFVTGRVERTQNLSSSHHLVLTSWRPWHVILTRASMRLASVQGLCCEKHARVHTRERKLSNSSCFWVSGKFNVCSLLGVFPEHWKLSVFCCWTCFLNMCCFCVVGRVSGVWET